MKRVGACLLAVCMMVGVCLCGCKKSADSEKSNQTEAVQTSEILTDENGVPYINEDFGADAIYYAAKGDAVLTIQSVGDDSDNQECVISERGTNNSGIYLPCDAFRCNTIHVVTAVKSANAKVMASLQYDIYGNTSYVTIGECKPSALSYTRITGDVAIPANASNISVYIEAGDVKDITVDFVNISVSGDYINPEDVPVQELADPSDYQSLALLYQDYFKMGVAMQTTIVPNENEEFRTLVTNEFNSMTFENEMKPENILDSDACLADPEKYNECPAVDFSGVTETLDWAKDNGIVVRGHTLIWYSQTPSWLFYENYDVNGELASRELMMTRMENYIKAVFEWAQENYPGVFYAWDVVNEAIDDNGGLRDCYWAQTIGDDYIELAFEYARKYAASDIELCYNDYNEYQASKQDDIIEVLKPVAEAGNIDCMGMQSHMTTGLSVDSYVEAMNRYADELGVSLMITELDIGAPDSDNSLYDQGLYFKKFFEALIEAKDSGTPIESVTFWGISDDLSWRSNTSPLLFAGNLEPKPAFYGVVGAMTNDEVPIPDDYVETVADYSPIFEDYEDGSYIGFTRYSSTIDVVTTDAYEGSSCLSNSGGSAEYDGYCIDISRFAGTTINFSFAIKTDAPMAHLTADIENEWPWLAEVDTSSGDWVYVEGTYEVPSDLPYLQIYFESSDMSTFYIDNVSISTSEAT